MSHFTTLQTQLVDAAALVLALNDLGFADVEQYETAEALYGYAGDRRTQTAEIILRRKYVGPASNDIGFKRGAEGRFEAIISEYDRKQYDQPWLNRLTQRYAYHVARSKLEQQGFDLVAEEVGQDGQIHLVLRRVS